ncbi:MAG TPA: peptidase M28 [Planctomycetaceae bacterium]|nr:peptidase M28 [Planctomycetaceae bacterium]HBC62307.1 peptidase M28 [Planctomycetaceae bacterium]
MAALLSVLSVGGMKMSLSQVIARYFAVLTVLCTGLTVMAQTTDPDITETNPAEARGLEERLVTRVRQLTFEGRRAGESYFSADGRRMIFQSEREPGNPFFQIYLMDLESGETQRVSPGTGKTTCAWIHPQGDRVLFASTQEDPDAKLEQQQEIELRASGKERRYAWDYDLFYDIYEYDLAAKTYRPLTREKGYDAEGSWSPDGSLIAFASNRSAYEETLTPEQQKAFELDPAWANEICVMNADGSNVRRLTSSPGYDGGPFFSPDGKRICWRRFSENGAVAEVMTMNIDGSDQRQLTKLGAMSWAPYFHPSGQYLIFTTNRHGFANFELYLVDAEAKHEPVRVTHTPGFDGLPVFSPDGAGLAWTAGRTVSGQSQIFMAEWNHAKALELLGLSSAQSAAAVAGTGRVMGAGVEGRGDFAPADAVRHVEYLCRPQLGGRLTGTKGEQLATNYVALHFETLGLEPAGDDGSWFQEFEFTSGVSAGPKNAATAAGHVLELKKDWQPAAFSANVELQRGDVVFAGYGLRVPAADGHEEYDSYVHLDVKDKWVLAFRFMPEKLTPEQRQHFGRFSSLRFKAMQARDLGARGLIIVSGPTSGVRDQLVPLQFDGSLAGAGLPVVSLSDAAAQYLFSAAGKDLKTVQEKLDSGVPAIGYPLKDAVFEAAVDIVHEKKKGRNVLGRLQVNEEQAGQVVVVGAHIDHLGTGPNGNSLARDDERGGIHFGADDNASGVSALMQMAEALANAKQAGQLQGSRDIVFAAWSGEELGLLGSSHYVKHLETLFSKHAAAAEGEGAAGEKQPRADGAAGEAEKPKEDPLSGPNTGGLNLYIAACLNMDMVGRLQEKLVLQGIGSSPAWQSLVERANVPLGLSISLQNDSYLPTDASVFFLHGVPILSAFTGNHGEYHTPRDTPEKLNYEGISKVARLMSLVCRQLISAEKPPQYAAQERPAEGQRRAALRAWLGTVPDYAQSDLAGVLLSGVAKGGPAEKSGVKGGDVIVKLAGKKIENIYDYTYAIESLKSGQETEIVVTRDGRELSFRVTPGSRD